MVARPHELRQPPSRPARRRPSLCALYWCIHRCVPCVLRSETSTDANAATCRRRNQPRTTTTSRLRGAVARFRGDVQPDVYDAEGNQQSLGRAPRSEKPLDSRVNLSACVNGERRFLYSLASPIREHRVDANHADPRLSPRHFERRRYRHEKPVDGTRPGNPVDGTRPIKFVTLALSTMSTALALSM